ncbi:PPE domain-containing protein [Mycobacterium sp.]|uniref:PPE domain-containing protein n=1 Tax=Mycobacterium sp. TaxID=1785 RepID=UPI002C34F4EA|nr:PPE domain-containing protein [Mycobacterium sp.]HME48072.1 PPE domain-containing protein [Mycobacterium sp.]
MYWGIPPETNDFRLRTGPGAAAVIPHILAYEEASAVHLEQAQQMVATTMATNSSWIGAGDMAMNETSLPMAAYIDVVGAHAQTAAQTINAAGQAHSGAVASSIPYPTVIANRVRETALESTNVIGQNSPAIAEANFEYGEYWAQNAGAMMGYLSAAVPLIQALSVPLAPSPLGANPAGMAAEVASLAVTGTEAGVQGMGNVLQQAATAGSTTADTGAGVAAGVASGVAGAASAASGSASQGGQAGSSTGEPAAAGQQGQAEAQMLQSAQGMAGPMTSAPSSLLQGATQPLSQLGQAPGMIGGQLGSLMGPMMSSMAGGGLGGAPPLSDLALNGPAAAAGGLGGANGGFAAGGGGSAISAALTKPSAGSSAMAGPVGVPTSWWASPGAGAAEEKAPAGVRGAAAPGGAMGPGMYGMPGAASARERRSTREAADPDKSVLLTGAGAGVPVLTDDGVVYAQGQGV